jgi:hypothetical protein
MHIERVTELLLRDWPTDGLFSILRRPEPMIVGWLCRAEQQRSDGVTNPTLGALLGRYCDDEKVGLRALLEQMCACGILTPLRSWHMTA